MTNKQLKFEIAGKGWDVQRRQLDAFIKSLENLKKTGHDVERVFKKIDTGSGVAKFNKDLATSVKSMTGISKEVKEYLKTFTDQRFKSSQDHLKTRVDQINVGIKKYVDLLRSANMETGKRLRYEENLTSLILKRETMQGQVGAGGLMGGLRSRASSMFPTGIGPMAAAGIIGGMGTGAVAMVGQVAGLAAMPARQRLEARMAVGDILTRPVVSAWHGGLAPEYYKKQLGIYDTAQAYEKRQRPLELLSRGEFGAAAGAESRLTNALVQAVTGASLTAIAAAGVMMLGAPVTLPVAAATVGGVALWRGAKGAYTDPKAVRTTASAQLFMEGKQGAERDPQNAFKIAAFQHLTDRTENYYQMQRLLGRGIYGPLETGLGGVHGELLSPGGPLRGQYTRDEIDRSILEVVERGGARAVDSPHWSGAQRLGGTVADALRYQREYGIERAGSIMGGLRGVTRYSGDVAPMMDDTLSMAVTKGLQRAEVKLETEAFVEASLAASERLANRYGGMTAAGLQGVNQQIAVSMGAMLPQDPTLMDLNKAGSAFESANQFMAGKTSTYMAARIKAPLLNFLAEGKGGVGPEVMRRLEDLAAVAPEMITPDNPMVAAAADIHYAGFGGTATADQRREFADSIREIRRTGTGGMFDLSSISSDQKRKLLHAIAAERDPQERLRLSHQLRFGTVFDMPGADENTKTMSAVRAANWTLPEDQRFSAEQFEAGPGPGAMSDVSGVTDSATATLAIGQRTAVAGGEYSMMEEIERSFPAMQKAVLDSTTAARDFTEALGEFKNIGPLTESFASSLSILVGVLERGELSLQNIVHGGGQPHQVEP